MTVLRSIVMAFAMFTRIPMPMVDWKKENMRFMLAAFPLVGAVLVGLYRLWLLVWQAAGWNKLVFAGGMALLPLLLTGGIHMDGFCDTVDALASHASPEKKRAILKDPHTGAFAVTGVAAYLLADFAMLSQAEATARSVLLLGLAACVSRALAALASLVFPATGETGLLRSFRDAAEKRPAIILLIAETLLLAAGMVGLGGWMGGGMFLAELLAMAWVGRISHKEFQGMSGDLAGCLIQTAEILALLAMMIGETLG